MWRLTRLSWLISFIFKKCIETWRLLLKSSTYTCVSLNSVALITLIFLNVYTVKRVVIIRILIISEFQEQECCSIHQIFCDKLFPPQFTSILRKCGAHGVKITRLTGYDLLNSTCDNVPEIIHEL